MRLLSLRLQNFRQHAETEIRFGPGLTGIFGPNGAGKSTLLEAIAWAIYGSEAARGTNETIRFARAGSRSRVEVDLSFGIGGHEYRVVRTLSAAEVFLDGGSVAAASSVGGVTRYLQGRLGMTRREFFNTYFTGQKELQFLAAMGSTDRGRFLSQVLGYERLRVAQERVRGRRNELKHEITGIRAGMGSLDEILLQRTAAEEQVRQAQAELARAEVERGEAASAVAAVAPRWDRAQVVRERHRELTSDIQAAEQQREAARRDMARTAAEIERVTQAENELAALLDQLTPLPAVAEEVQRLSELARKHERRMALLEQLQATDADLARTDERIARIAQAPEHARRYAAELETLRAEQKVAEKEQEERRTTWLRDRQDAETKLQSFRDRGIELKEQIRGIRQAGAEGKCPTCERPLGADFPRVLKELEDQWAEVVQDGKWWSQRFQQLKEKPEEVTDAEARLAALNQAVDQTLNKRSRCEAVMQELQTLQEQRAEQVARREKLRRDVEAVPAGYDRAVHDAAEAQLRMLRDLETRAARLEETTRRRAHWERERAEATQRESTAAERTAAAAAERQALRFSEEGFAAVRDENARADARLHSAELRATELKGQLRGAEQSRAAAVQAEAEFQERLREVE
nr:SMC family ATPase [Gemmatimonadota bacterium]